MCTYNIPIHISGSFKRGSIVYSSHDQMPEAVCAALLSSSPPCPSTFPSLPSPLIEPIYRYHERQGHAFSADCLSSRTSSPLIPPSWKPTPFSPALFPFLVIHFLCFPLNFLSPLVPFFLSLNQCPPHEDTHTLVCLCCSCLAAEIIKHIYFFFAWIYFWLFWGKRNCLLPENFLAPLVLTFTPLDACSHINSLKNTLLDAVSNFFQPFACFFFSPCYWSRTVAPQLTATICLSCHCDRTCVMVCTGLDWSIDLLPYSTLTTPKFNHLPADFAGWWV